MSIDNIYISIDSKYKQHMSMQFAEAPRVTREALLEKSKKSTPRKLLFGTCSRGSKNAGRGSFAEGPAEGSRYVHLKYEGIKNKTHVLNPFQ